MTSCARPGWISGLLVLCLVGGCVERTGSRTEESVTTDRPPFNPRTYAAPRTATPPTIDGNLDDAAWSATRWTTPFVNSQGADHPSPQFRTRAKMTWDENYFYLAAKLEESDVRASFTTRDTTVWRENAFEVFVDPTGDTHNYYEYQINARETQWDLLLTKPYRDGGTPISAWNIRGLKKGVVIQGTLNDPSDTDEGWTIELAFPWDVLAEAAPDAEPPTPGDQWRVNLTRMQWPARVVEGSYVQDSTNNEASAWSPQGKGGGYHKPERWGIVEFFGAPSETGVDSIQVPVNERVKWALRRLYYRQNRYREDQGAYASSLSTLNAEQISLHAHPFEPTLTNTQSMYEITAPGVGRTLVHIRQDGKVWITEE